MSELGMTRVNVSDGDDSGYQPFVGSATIEVRSGELDGTGIFVGTGRAVECERLVRVICVANLNVVGRLCVVTVLDVVWKPFLVPFVDLVVVRRIILRIRVGGDCAEILNGECVQGRDFFEMNWVVEVIESECSGCEARECFVEEPSIRRRVRRVGREINRRRVDHRIGGYIGHG